MGEEEDRISKLSDDLLCHILSYIDSPVAVQTSVLSKRWVNLWTTLPCLNFEPNPYADTDYDYSCKFVTNFLKYRNQESVISTINIDCIRHRDKKILKICLDYALSRTVEHLRMRSGDFSDAPCLNSAFIKTLHLTNCLYLRPIDDWMLPSLTSLYLRNVYFGDHISGFQNLKELTLSGCSQIFWDIDEDFTINCPNLQSLALGSDFSHCSLVVSTPKLSYFEFHSGHVEEFSAGDGFPCIKEVDFDIEIKDDNGDLQVDDEYRIGLAMYNFVPMLHAVKETPLLKFSSETIQFLRRVPDFSIYQPCPLCNLKFLYVQGLYEIPTRSTDHVINYLLSNSPHAEVLKGHLGGIKNL